MTDKNRPPPAKTRQQRLLDIINAPPSKEMLELVDPTSVRNISTAAKADEIMARPTPEAVLSAMEGRDDVFARVKAFLLSRTAPNSNTNETLSPGEEFVEPTLEEILAKPSRPEIDMLLAPTSDARLAALSVGVLKNKDGSDQVYIMGRDLENYLARGGMPDIPNFNVVPFEKAQRDIAKRYIGIVAETPDGELTPGLAKRMSENPKVREYANYAIEAGNRAGINGIMYANQLWAESRFNPMSVSGKGAMGIAQMMPFHLGNYGLETQSDFFDAKKSIDAGAKMMFEMTDRYKDQRLALVAYNGGGGAIAFVADRLEKDQITYADWHGFMENRRSTAPSNKPSAWQNETLNYINQIAGRPITERAPMIAPEPVR